MFDNVWNNRAKKYQEIKDEVVHIKKDMYQERVMNLKFI